MPLDVLNHVLGRDFNPDVALTIQAQVERLIQEATSLENLCQCFSGWCATSLIHCCAYLIRAHLTGVHSGDFLLFNSITVVYTIMDYENLASLGPNAYQD